MARQIVLDTETTGLSPADGHRIIEVGCVELVNRRLTGKNFHEYMNPEREIEQGAIDVHGITNEFLQDKPLFDEIAEKLMDFLSGAELIIHNAPFDVGFLNHELKLIQSKYKTVEEHCGIIDTLVMARKLHPGQKNNLDALCSRYEVNNTHRQLHGALLDSEILANVYLAMTGGQVSLFAEDSEQEESLDEKSIEATLSRAYDTPVVVATSEELRCHEAYLELLDQHSNNQTVWRNID